MGELRKFDTGSTDLLSTALWRDLKPDAGIYTPSRSDRACHCCWPSSRSSWSATV